MYCYKCKEWVLSTIFDSVDTGGIRRVISSCPHCGYTEIQVSEVAKLIALTGGTLLVSNDGVAVSNSSQEVAWPDATSKYVDAWSWTSND